MRKKKTAENKNESVIHRDIIENEKETHRDTFDKVIEECLDDKTPAEID